GYDDVAPPDRFPPAAAHRRRPRAWRAGPLGQWLAAGGAGRAAGTADANPDPRAHADIAATRRTAAGDANAAGHRNPRAGARAARYPLDRDAAPGSAGSTARDGACNHRQSAVTAARYGYATARRNRRRGAGDC